MKKLLMTVLALALLALPAMAEADPTEAPAPAQSEAPAFDDTIQQAAGDPVPGGDQANADPDATLPPVPSVVMQLVEQEKPLSGVKIGIDPGHQAKGNNQKETVAPNSKKTKPKVSSGTAGVKTRIPEYKTTLEISLKLRDALVEKGAEVYMTRETHDVDISNQERAKMMNALGVDLVLRIHCDGVDNHSKHGIALYCSKSNSIAAESYRACEAILPAVCAATGFFSKSLILIKNYLKKMSNEETKEPIQTFPENAQTTIETGTLSKDQNDTIPASKKQKRKKNKKKPSELQLDSNTKPNLTNFKFKSIFSSNALS